MFYNGVLVTNFGFVVWINSFSSRVKYSSFRIFEISLLSIKKWFLSLEMGEREEEEIKLKLINFFFFFILREIDTFRSAISKKKILSRTASNCH